MFVAPLLVGCVLTGQLSTPSASNPPAVTPPEMVTRAMALPADGSLSGRPLTLTEAMASAADAPAQAEVAHDYWRLTAAVARYNARREHASLLGDVSPRDEDRAAHATAAAEAAARVAEAELDLLAAQHDLVSRAGLSLEDPLPLPVDPPHAGTYRTGFDEIFAARPAPTQSRAIDRRLPVHRRLIDHRARAVQSAAVVWNTAVGAYRAGAGDLDRCVAAAGEFARQREAFFDAVCQYNHDIVDYAALALDRPLGPAVFVARLIQQPGGGSAQPLVVDSSRQGLPWQQPTLAPRPTTVQPAVEFQPMPGSRPQPAGAVGPTDTEWRAGLADGASDPRDPGKPGAQRDRLDRADPPELVPLDGTGFSPQIPPRQPPASEPEAPKLPVVPVVGG
ncbi:MAG: hypothetical protein JW809_12800 [Pirellulales bacterium]|nr:hypothetical protein [Pirellulales bacterium]